MVVYAALDLPADWAGRLAAGGGEC